MKARSKKRVIPAFATETEEANWWYENRKKLDADLTRTSRAGLSTLDRKTLAARIARTRAAKIISIRVPESDLRLAREQAASRGLPYQTYIKSLLHQALRRTPRSEGRSVSR